MSTKAPEKHAFQAEVKQVLDIVVNSLYTDKEIFIRELVSNASDSLEKLRHLQITEKNVFDDRLALEINITTDDKAGTITIQDFGIGMNENELVENLGTIAHSGTKAFLNAVKEKGENNENVIGQFGVGFYSAFMVADQVKVYTHSWRTEDKGYCWTSDGAGEYEIEEAEGQRRGAKLVLKLKEDYKEFSSADRVKEIIKRYSSYVPFPVNVNGDKINTMDAIWLRGKSDIKEEEYKEFYKFQANAFDEPTYWLHFNADAPLTINTLLFVPTQNMEQFGMGRMESKVALHCRKVLIDAKPKNLLPEWLRFLSGVIDSADIPLNISRESMQDSGLIQKLNKVITTRFLKFLDKESSKDKEKFNKFWNTFNVFIKEGVATDYTHREALSKLLRFESSFTKKGELTSFDEYVTRMKDGQENIFYIIGQNRASIEAGPYMEAFKARGIEVIYLFENIDEFVMNHLAEFDKKKLVSADGDDVKLDKLENEPTGEALSEDDSKALCEWMKTVYDNKVTAVEVSDRLVDSPAFALNTDKFMSSNMRKMMKAMNPEADEADEPASVKLQINTRNGLIKKLWETKGKDEDLAKLIAYQILDVSLISGGFLEDPKDMVKRSYELLEKL